MNIQKRQQIRSEIRKIRANLTALQQQQAEQSVTQQALNLIDQRQAKNIAVYFSFDGEISTKALIQFLWMQNKNVYLLLINREIALAWAVGFMIARYRIGKINLLFR